MLEKIFYSGILFMQSTWQAVNSKQELAGNGNEELCKAGLILFKALEIY